MKVSILLPCGKHLHDSSISLKGKAFVHQYSLRPLLFNAVAVPSQDSELSLMCMCVCTKGIDFAFCLDFSFGF